MGDQVEALVTMCLQGLRDPHPKVRPEVSAGSKALTGNTTRCQLHHHPPVFTVC